MVKNLELYNKISAVPKDAQKPITGGRLKGMTDIEPMWRIRTLTEQFGPFGVGWYYIVEREWLETAEATDEVAAFVRISLYYKIGDEWSMPCQGVGGSGFVSMQKGALYVNDECYKMALTDAISVACKGLGMGADIYWGKGNTKYNDAKKDNFIEEKSKEAAVQAEMDRLSATKISDMHAQNIRDKAGAMGIALEVVLHEYNVASIDDMTEAMYGDCMNKFAAEENKRKK